ncbi:MAG: ROK family transcriptional regulator [Nitratireductor sp.]|nr:ROK family transcriptional regulator [Nitratireductor sp.]
MTVIARSDDLRRENQRRILSALRATGPVSRTGLSVQTGLSASTITAITGALRESEYVIEAEADAYAPAGHQDDGKEAARPTRRGRPQVALSLNPGAASVGALAVSYNRLSASLIDYCGQLIDETYVSVDIKSLAPAEFSRHLIVMLDTILKRSSDMAGPLRNIVVAVQGVSDAEGTRFQWSPITPHRNIEIGSALEQHFQVPVKVLNDANMIAAALRNLEPERYGNSFAAILLSQGIGMGMFLHDKLFAGVLSSAAEFGHMCNIPNGALCRCGRHGCVEAYAGYYAILRRAGGSDPRQLPEDEKVGIELETMRKLVEKARTGDFMAAEAYREAGAALGNGLRSLFALLDPMPVAFVGSGVVAFDLMEPEIRASLGRGVGLSHENVEIHCYPDDVGLARLGTISTALAALDRTISPNRTADAGMLEETG